MSGKRVMTHFDLFLPQYQHQRKCFFSERELKKTLRDASSVVWSLIDHGKLANKFARLAAIVVFVI